VNDDGRWARGERSERRALDSVHGVTVADRHTYARRALVDCDLAALARRDPSPEGPRHDELPVDLPADEHAAQRERQRVHDDEPARAHVGRGRRRDTRRCTAGAVSEEHSEAER
jgi:hypothetical protein